MVSQNCSNEKRGQDTEGDPLFGEVAKEGLTALGSQGIGKASGFLLHLILGRFLGPIGYGLYSLGLSVSNVLADISRIGLDQGVVRYAGRLGPTGDQEEVRDIVGVSFLLGGLLGVFFAVALYFASPHLANSVFDDPSLTSVFQVFSFALPFLVVTGLLGAGLQAIREIATQQGLLQIFRPLSLLVLVGIVLHLGFDVLGAAWAFVTISAATSGVGIYTLRKKLGRRILLGHHGWDIHRLLRFSIPTFFVGISYTLMNYLDRLMLGFFSVSADVGVYSAAAILSFQATIVLSAFISIFSPIISDLHSEGDLHRMKQVYRTTSRWVLTLTIPLILVVFLVPSDLIALFGPGYSAGATVLVVLVLAQFFNVMTGPVGMVLQMSGKQDLELLNGVGLVLLNFLLNALLIPPYGILGAAIATGLSLFTIHTVRLGETYHIFGLHPITTEYLKPIIAGLTAYSIAYTGIFFLGGESGLVIVGLVVISLAAYGLLLHFLGMAPRDRAAILRLLEMLRKSPS